MKISKKLQESIKEKRPAWSFEYFPPKTAVGVRNLYDRMERMYELGPEFIDITWNAGGRLSNLTCEMVATAQSVYGLETCMHLTCTGMPREKVDEALEDAYKAGCQNILALRGDPPRDEEKWEQTDGGFRYSKDLVKHIKDKYDDYFDIAVAGYPEGHPDDEEDEDANIRYLKEKVDAGATFVITQMFYDVDNFLDWVKRCRKAGIDVPLIPGIMPIQSWDAFLRRAKWSGVKIPQHFLDALEPVKDDDAEVRLRGTKLMVEVCKKILDAGIYQLHFYTMNLEKATKMILEGLECEASPGNLPWKPSLGLKRKEENVRPIFWKNKHKSYIARTEEWDEFPNGRWGDARSPAYGGLDVYDGLLKCSNEEAHKMWGYPTSIGDVGDLFARFCEGKVPQLPWSDSAITEEAASIRDALVKLNRHGFITVNSQPAVNGVKSTDPVFGWGPKNGYVYQKCYLEVFVHPDQLDLLIQNMSKEDEITYYAVNKNGDLHTNTTSDEPNAVTWGVFPGKEIIQPTIVETVSFMAWKDEAFRLGFDWARCYAPGSESRKLIEDLMDTWYLVNIVHNDFHEPCKIFEVFETIEPVVGHANGANGDHKTNGYTNSASNGIVEACEKVSLN
ncbi:methylenetetrahydrofolate reductase (NAD(P)H) met13 [Saitoella coloradoensis]